MTTRQDFEAWYMTAFHPSLLHLFEDGRYRNPQAGMAWNAWQAATERQQAKIKALVDAAELVIAWYEAEDDHSKEPDFYKRIAMCRASEDAIRAALAQQEKQAREPVAIVAEVHMSRYTLEWTNGPLPEGAKLYAAPPTQPALSNPDIVGLINAAGFKTWDSRFFALCKSVAAHCRGGANHG